MGDGRHCGNHAEVIGTVAHSLATCYPISCECDTPKTSEQFLPYPTPCKIPFLQGGCDLSHRMTFRDRNPKKSQKGLLSMVQETYPENSQKIENTHFRVFWGVLHFLGGCFRCIFRGVFQKTLFDIFCELDSRKWWLGSQCMVIGGRTALWFSRAGVYIFSQERPFVRNSVCSQVWGSLFAILAPCSQFCLRPLNRNSRGNPSCWLEGVVKGHQNREQTFCEQTGVSYLGNTDSCEDSSLNRMFQMTLIIKAIACLCKQSKNKSAPPLSETPQNETRL